MSISMDHPIHFNGPHLALAVVLYVLGVTVGVVNTPEHPFLTFIQGLSSVFVILVAMKTLLNIKSGSDVNKLYQGMKNLFHKIW